MLTEDGLIIMLREMGNTARNLGRVDQLKTQTEHRMIAQGEQLDRLTTRLVRLEAENKEMSERIKDWERYADKIEADIKAVAKKRGFRFTTAEQPARDIPF